MTAYVGTGDHVLITDSAYRPTRSYCDGVLKRMGVETTYYDPLIGTGITELIQPNTKIVYVEAPGSQTFEMQDIPAIAEAAHAAGAVVLMDNTWATPSSSGRSTRVWTSRSTPAPSTLSVIRMRCWGS